MRRSHLPRLVFLPTLLAALLPATIAASPEIRTEAAGKITLIRVDTFTDDGGARSVLLRETASSVTDIRAGGDPTGAALFATWAEGTERWGAHSRDAGLTWTPARVVRQGLRLRDATVAPSSSMPPPAAELALPPDGRLYLVQFRTVGLPEWRAAVTAEGAEILGHVPHNAHIVRVDGDRIEALRALEFVERVEPYHPSYRLEGELRDDVLARNGSLGVEERVRIVVFEWGPVAKERVLAAAEALGARVAKYWPSGHVLELWIDRQQLLALAAHDDVQWIERWTPSGPDMDLVREDSGANFVENGLAYCGSGVRGEVMDGGIQDDHPDFDGIVLHGPYNVDSHGTSTYGIVFGNGDRDGDGDGKGTGHDGRATSAGDLRRLRRAGHRSLRAHPGAEGRRTVLCLVPDQLVGRPARPRSYTSA